VVGVGTPTYRHGILSDPIEIDQGPSRRKAYPIVAADRGLEVVHQATGMAASVIEWTESVVVLRDDSGRDHRVRNLPGVFLVGGRSTTLGRPTPVAATAPALTASGSVAGAPAPARVARASRILVEGIHDAALVEKVWGDDLRDEGIVVVPIDGADDLAEVVRGFGPRQGRRLGVLLDHLIADTKESRIAAGIDHPEVLIRGHRFVDVWAAIDPRLVGLDRWPDIPRGTSWKDGICAATGFDEPRVFWHHLLGKVSSFRDLDPSLVGAVEELIDFVAAA
jgi:hypothetical protein